MLPNGSIDFLKKSNKRVGSMDNGMAEDVTPSAMFQKYNSTHIPLIRRLDVPGGGFISPQRHKAEWKKRDVCEVV